MKQCRPILVSRTLLGESGSSTRSLMWCSCATLLQTTLGWDLLAPFCLSHCLTLHRTITDALAKENVLAIEKMSYTLSARAGHWILVFHLSSVDH